MPKKSKRQRRSSKWSRANIMNYIMGGIIALSMLLGSVFVFGGASTASVAPPAPTLVIPTTAPSSLQSGATATVAVTPTP